MASARTSVTRSSQPADSMTAWSLSWAGWLAPMMVTGFHCRVAGNTYVDWQ
jgi:hypothetical protein